MDMQSKEKRGKTERNGKKQAEKQEKEEEKINFGLAHNF